MVLDDFLANRQAEARTLRLVGQRIAHLFGFFEPLWFLSPFGDITLWNILVSCVVIPYISLYSRMTNLMLWGHILSVAPETSSMEGGARFHLDTSHNRPYPFVTGCHHAAPRGVCRSMTPRHRSRCACARRRPARPVRCAPPRRGVSIVTMGAPWPTCPGRSIGCASSSASASGFAAIAPAVAVSSPNACPPWPPPGRGAPCGWPSAWCALGVALGGKAGVQPRPRVGPGGEPEHPPAPAPEAAAARFAHAPGAGGGRFRPAETAHLWHDPGGSGAPPARGAAPGADGRDRGAVAPGASGGGGASHGIGRVRMPRAHGRGLPRPPRSRTVFICCRISREALDQVFTTHGQALDAVNALMRQQPVLLPDGASRGARAPTRQTPPARAAARGGSARPAGRHCICRSGPCTARAGRPRPSPQQVGLRLRTVERDLRSTTLCGAANGAALWAQYPQSL